MIARPSWEKPLRRRLRKWRKCQPVPRWIADQGGTIVILFILQCVLASDGLPTLGSGGGGTGIGAVSGLVGSLLAMSLRSRWQSREWLLHWTPATPAAVRKLGTREILPRMAIAALVTLILSCLASGFSEGTGTVEALAATAVAMASGFLLAGGRISTGFLYAGIVWVIAYSIVGGWFGYGEKELSTRLLKGTVQAWLPVLPWSLATHGTPAPALHLGILAVASVISLREWRSAWSPRMVPADETEVVAPAALVPDADDVESPLEEVAETTSEDRRRNVRQHVAFAWFGMAGYLPEEPGSWLDRLLWRWFTPRQRFLSCLGTHEAMRWFPRTWWTAGGLALLVVLARLTPWLEAQAWFEARFAWFFVVVVTLGGAAIFAGWPGRNARFQPWLELMQTPGLGQFPSFAVLPVTPGEWIRAMAKEWIVRSAWVSSLWSVAIVAGRAGMGSGSSLSWLLAFAALPWLIHAMWFPLTALHRLARAVSGPAFRIHGITRVLPALVSCLLAWLAAAAAFMAIGAGSLAATSASLAIGTALGAFSLWMTFLRCRGMRLDLKPKPLD